MRVVSLLPAATEILCHIGGRDLLVARSHECDQPPDLASLPALTAPRVTHRDPAEAHRQAAQALREHGSLYHLDTDGLRHARPDVILTQSLCAVCSIDLSTVQQAAQQLKPPPAVIDLNPQGFEDVLDDVTRVGHAVGRETQARDAVVNLRERFYAAAEHVSAFTAPTHLAFLEWTDPIFVAGHWTPQLIERAGGDHPLNPTHAKHDAGAAIGPQHAERLAGPSITVTADQLVDSRPHALIVCPCGIDLPGAVRAATKLFHQHPALADTPAVRDARIAAVDGNRMFNRPAPSLVQAFEFLVGWLNHRPDLIPERFPWQPVAPPPPSPPSAPR